MRKHRFTVADSTNRPTHKIHNGNSVAESSHLDYSDQQQQPLQSRHLALINIPILDLSLSVNHLLTDIYKKGLVAVNAQIVDSL